MKGPLLTITIPMILSFLSGFFELYMDDGMYTIFGLAIIAGLIWAWWVELKK